MVSQADHRVVQLIHDQYQAQGYLPYTPPSGKTFIIEEGDQVIGTATVITSYPLPMDSVYPDELAQLRAQGRKIAEVVGLAIKTPRRIFMRLVRAIIHDLVEQGMDDLCVVINPKHERFYTRILEFKSLGGLKDYPLVGAPSVALHLDLQLVRALKGGLEPLNTKARRSLFA